MGVVDFPVRWMYFMDIQFDMPPLGVDIPGHAHCCKVEYHITGNSNCRFADSPVHTYQVIP